MRAVSWVFAVVGGCALVVAVVGNLVDGDPAGAGWILIGPAPLYAVGLAGAFRGRGHPVAVWLLAGGSLVMLSQCLGDVVLTHAGSRPRAGSSSRDCARTRSQVAGIGLIGLFPTGRPDRTWQRAVLIAAGGLALLMPVLVLVVQPGGRRATRSPARTLRPSPARSSWRAPGPRRTAANVAYQAFAA